VRLNIKFFVDINVDIHIVIVGRVADVVDEFYQGMQAGILHAL